MIKLTKKEWAKRRVTRALDPKDILLHESWCALHINSRYECNCEYPDDHDN